MAKGKGVRVKDGDPIHRKIDKIFRDKEFKDLRDTRISSHAIDYLFNEVKPPTEPMEQLGKCTRYGQAIDWIATLEPTQKNVMKNILLELAEVDDVHEAMQNYFIHAKFDEITRDRAEAPKRRR
ncbi:MAG: hypothetical protein SFT92_08820 [Rickettsiales bacterium]|nr:hypothetical protein [Rickettsiales bacterium]